MYAFIVCRNGDSGVLVHPPKVGILGGGQLGKMLAMEAVGHRSTFQLLCNTVHSMYHLLFAVQSKALW